MVDNHALVDGNERLGWLAPAVFLELNEASVVSATNDAVYDLVMKVASSAMTVDDIAISCSRSHHGPERSARGEIGAPIHRVRGAEPGA